MDFIRTINFIITLVFFICYSYQIFYIPVSVFKKEPFHKPPEKHRFAVLISARNEEKVIGELIKSIRSQTYGTKNIRIFVIADNCTDETARVARNFGARVYKRFNLEKIGKGYALEELLQHISEDYPKNYFDGFFVFDADNVLDEKYIEEMNKTFSDGYKIITSYRNSKNYGENWISAGYSLWFLRESRFLNHSRFLLGNSCAVSGTGFFFSREIFEKCKGWPFHLLTEDIEFTVHNITRGEKIGFCKNAVLYDEQPVLFSQSWNQRMRWAKGYLQVFGEYKKELFKGIFRGDFSCFDMTMNIMPAVVLSVFCALINGFVSFAAIFSGESIVPVIFSVGESIFNMYLTLFAIGAITTVTEWKQIHTKPLKKIFYVFTFPLFMFTYIPISVAAIFKKVEWKPIEHKIKTSAEEIRKSA